MASGHKSNRIVYRSRQKPKTDCTTTASVKLRSLIGTRSILIYTFSSARRFSFDLRFRFAKPKQSYSLIPVRRSRGGLKRIDRYMRSDRSHRDPPRPHDVGRIWVNPIWTDHAPQDASQSPRSSPTIYKIYRPISRDHSQARTFSNKMFIGRPSSFV